jgi:hypothetical protein
MNALFPWLSTVAQNFEEYKIHGMVVYLNTLSGFGIASTNTALGLWGAVTQYDPTEPDFVSKQQAENYVGCQTAVPSCSMMHGIECVPNSNILNKMFVRTGAIPDGEDLKFYDWGKLQIFTQGSQNVNVIGEMWVSYDIEFTKPRLPTGGSNTVYSDRYYVTGATALNPLGISSVPLIGSNLGSSVNAGGTVINIPATAANTNYLLAIKWDNAASFNSTVPTLTPGGSLTSRNYFTGNSVSITQSPQASIANNRWITLLYTFNKSSFSAGTITVANLPVLTVAAVDIVITQISNTFTATSQLQEDKLDDSELKWLRRFIERVKKIDQEDVADIDFGMSNITPQKQLFGKLEEIVKGTPASDIIID